MSEQNPGAEPEEARPLWWGPAISALTAGNFESAMRYFESGISEQPADRWMALARLGRGFCLEVLGNSSEAELEAHRAADVWRKQGAAAAWTLAAVGHGLVEVDQATLGIAYLDVANRLASSGADAEISGDVLVELGAAAAASSDVETASSYWRSAMQQGNEEAQACAAANLARVAASDGDTEAALRYMDRAMRLTHGPHLKVVADALVDLAGRSLSDERWFDAQTLLRRALPLRKMDAEPIAIAETLHDLGLAAERLGQYEEALHWYEDCRGAALTAKDIGLEAAALRGLGAASLRLGRVVVALACAQQAGRVARRRQDRESAAALLKEIGEIARRDGAAALFAEAMQLATQLSSSSSSPDLAEKLDRLERERRESSQQPG